MRPPLAAALLLATFAAPGLARDRHAIPDATPTGAAVTCIPIVQIEESRVRSDQVIDFVMRGRDQVYRVDLGRPCPELGFEQRFSYETSLSQLCSTDIITVFQTSPPMRGASCGLAPFQPVTLAHR